VTAEPAKLPLETRSERTVVPIGAEGPRFEGLVGTDGRRYGFEELRDRSALVLIFSSNRCPTAKAYGRRMVELQRDYGDRGVQLIAINSNDPHLFPDERSAMMVDRAADDGYTFPYVVDEGQDVAKAYGASCTFHVFVLDRERWVRYEGRFDDSRLEERVRSHDLRDALDDILAERDVRTPVTRPFGCSLDFV
jgi:peroxiredoxin